MSGDCTAQHLARLHNFSYNISWPSRTFLASLKSSVCVEIHGVCRADSPAGASNIFVYSLKLNKGHNWFHLLVDAVSQLGARTTRIFSWKAIDIHRLQSLCFSESLRIKIFSPTQQGLDSQGRLGECFYQYCSLARKLNWQWKKAMNYS